MRRKSDILIKYFQLPNTMFLSHEALGLLVRRMIIETDVTGLRYENLDEETANELRRMEQQWENDYQTFRKSNPMFIQAKSSLSVQVNKSNKAFEALRQRLDEKNLDGSVDDPEPEITACGTTEFDITTAGKVFSFLPNGTEKTANFPNKEDIQQYLKSLELDDSEKTEIIKYITQIGCNDKWNKHWRKLASEAEATLL